MSSWNPHSLFNSLHKLPETQMTLTHEQFSELVDTYSEFIVDSMDMDSLVQFAMDSLVAEFTKYTENELIGEIRELYDDEIVSEMLESIGADPVVIL